LNGWTGTHAGGSNHRGLTNLTSSRELLYLSRADVEKVGMSMKDVIGVVEQAFVEKGLGKAQMPPKPSIAPHADSFIHAMPAYIPSMSAAGIKWISGYPDNYRRGLPYISGLIILNQPETGLPMAVMDATWVTAMRTGAATAVAAKYLARQDAESVAIIGCGVQGRTNLEALVTQFPGLRHVHAYDIRPKGLNSYASEMRKRFDLEVTKDRSAREAVRCADIVVTATPILKHPSPPIQGDWLQPGAFACPLDFDSSFAPSAFAAMDKLYTDDLQQQRHFVEEGYFLQMPQPHGDLGEVVCGLKPGRETRDERIMSVNLGLAIEDMSAARRLYGLARRKGLGQYLEL